MSPQTQVPEDDLAASYTSWITCLYVNATSLMQIARIADSEDLFFERVVCPGKYIVFKSPADAVLEIYSSELVTGVLADRIPCSQLECSWDTSSSADSQAMAMQIG
jgi:hypothetical protein